jgi:hypothetical protein
MLPTTINTGMARSSPLRRCRGTNVMLSLGVFTDESVFVEDPSSVTTQRLVS